MSSFHTILSHEVQDYATWRTQFDAHAPKREQHGIQIDGVYAALDNPNHITVMARLASPDALQSFMGDPEVQATMQQAGVIGRPQVQMLQAV